MNLAGAYALAFGFMKERLTLSSFLDSEQRIIASKVIKRYACRILTFDA